MSPPQPDVKPLQRQQRVLGIRRVHVAGWVDEQLYAILYARADKRNVSLSRLVDEIIEEVIDNIDMTDAFPEDARPQEGRAPYRPGVDRVHVGGYVHPVRHQRLEGIAKAYGTSVSHVVSVALAQYVGVEL